MPEHGKFKALVHYVCWKCSDDPSKLGAVKLNKALWFSDVLSYADRGKPITDARYVKQQFGPVPKAILPILRTLEQENALRIEEVEYYGHRKRQYVALVEPDLSVFDESEIKIINKVIDVITDGHTAASISDLTHDEIWKLAEMGEEIPLHAVLASRLGKVTENDIKRAQERMEEAA